MTSPADVLIVKLLQDALDTQPTIIGQPNDDDLLTLKEEKLLDVLQTISYDRVGSFHHVVRYIQSETANMSDHGGIPHFPSQSQSTLALACGMTRLPKTRQWWK